MSILVTLLFALIVMGLVYAIATLIVGAIPGFPPVVKQIVLAFMLLVLLIWILNIAGFMGERWIIRVP